MPLHLQFGTRHRAMIHPHLHMHMSCCFYLHDTQHVPWVRSKCRLGAAPTSVQPAAQSASLRPPCMPCTVQAEARHVAASSTNECIGCSGIDALHASCSAVNMAAAQPAASPCMKGNPLCCAPLFAIFATGHVRYASVDMLIPCR